MTTWLRAEVSKSYAPPWNAVTEHAIFGKLTADQIVDALAAACEESLGVGLRDGFLYQVSAGIVIGCDLADGRQVVLKAYQPRWTPEFLEAVKRTQRHLHDLGYPCPRPLDTHLVIGHARVLAESVLQDPGYGPASDASRAALATGLAVLVDHCRSLDETRLAEHPLRRPFEGPFPAPHSPIFDFDATRDGAEWIETLAMRAREVIEEDASPPLIAHTDWSLRNVRVNGPDLVAVYDWDSLALLRESEAIALGAATWCRTGEPGDPTPTPDDIEAYVDTYEAERGRALTAVQHKAIRAAVVATMAYTARCEHCIDPHEQTWTTTRPQLRDTASRLF